jgi:hypothetical protein
VYLKAKFFSFALIPGLKTVQLKGDVTGSSGIAGFGTREEMS